MADQQLKSNQPISPSDALWLGALAGAGFLGMGAVMSHPRIEESSFENWSQEAREAYLAKGAGGPKGQYAARKLIHEQIADIRAEIPDVDDSAVKAAVRRLHGVGGLKASRIKL